MKTLQEVLNDELSAEKVKEMDTITLQEFLVSNNIVKSNADVRMLIIEGIQKVLADDDEFPIHYYNKEEPMSESGKEVNVGSCLTDEYIENNFN